MATGDAPHPVEIELDRTRALRIVWSDGVASRVGLATLRKACPCAVCRDKPSATPASGGLLPIVSAGEGARAMCTATGAELVGHYALRVYWEDGHNSGIYDFGRLRKLGEEAG